MVWRLFVCEDCVTELLDGIVWQDCVCLNVAGNNRGMVECKIVDRGNQAVFMIAE